MKKIMIGMIAVALTFSATAQKNGDSKKDNREQKETKHRKFKGGENYDNLNLTDAQKQQVKSLNENFRQKMKDLHKQGNITVDQQKEKRQALAKEHKDKIAAILTPEQRDQLSKNFKGDWKDGNRENRVRGSKDGGRDDRFGAFTKDLNLTPQQSAKMESINAAFRTNLQNVKQNASLSQEEKKEQMKKLMKQHRSEMEALLTNDQKEQLKSRQKNRPNRAAVK
jgi:Spy/CpxP family protein refolding chaperone